MGLTIHWDFRSSLLKADARAAMEKMRQRALDLPFESVSEMVHFQGADAQFDPDNMKEPFRWLKIQALGRLWNKDGSMGWEFPPKEISGFEIVVAPGCGKMEVFLASYPKTTVVEDDGWGKSRRLRTHYVSWSGGGCCKTQYASRPDFGGIANFLRAHLSVCRLLDFAEELGILAKVTDEGEFFHKRDVPALVNEVGDWNAMIAASVGAFGNLLEAPIKSFPDFEHLEAKGAKRIDAWLRGLKEEG